MANGNLVGVTDAAAALGVSASTVSRYLTKHPDLNRAPKGARPMVDVDALRAHRDSTLLAGDGRASATPQRIAGSEKAEPHSAQAAPPPGPPSGGPSYSQAQAALTTTKALKARLEFDQLLGDLVPTGEVQDAAAEAGQLLQNLLMDLAPRLADELAVAKDPAAITAHLEQEFREMLSRFAQTLEVKKREHQAA